MKVNCKCKSDFQDNLLGVGVRWATPVNKTKKDGKLLEVRCTVCRQSHNKHH